MELIRGQRRFCIWIEDNVVEEALQIASIKERVEKVKQFRQSSKKKATVKAAAWAYRFDGGSHCLKNLSYVYP